MKNLKILSYAVKPAVPEPNSLIIVDDKILYYDNNNNETILVTGEDLSLYAKKSDLATKADTNHVHTWVSITGKPTTFTPVIGATANTAKAGNYVPTTAEVVTALKAMTPAQITEIKTLLGIIA